MWKQTLISYWLLFLFLLLASLTAQGLSFAGGSFGFFDGNSATCHFSTLVELSFWWSFPSGGVILLHTASALHSGGGFSLTTAVLLCSPVRCGGALFVASSGSHN